jgi:hypothetical protein
LPIEAIVERTGEMEIVGDQGLDRFPVLSHEGVVNVEGNPDGFVGHGHASDWRLPID